jgi:hypothetical protein
VEDDIQMQEMVFGKGPNPKGTKGHKKLQSQMSPPKFKQFVANYDN